MAQGDKKTFDALLTYYRGPVNLNSDQWAYALLTNTFASISKSASSPALSSFTQCSAGGNYPSGGINLTLNNTETGGVHTMKLSTSIHTGGVVTIAQHASNPNNARCALIYSKTASSPTGAAVQVYDLTEDGSTPADLSTVALEHTLGIGGVAGEILRITVN